MLKAIYEDYSNPGSLSSIEKLYKAAKQKDENITRKEVVNFLRSQESYTLHKPVKHRYSRRKFFFPYSGFGLCIDIAFVNKYKKENVPYLLYILDGFSRYLEVIPISRIIASQMEQALTDFFEKKSLYDYKYIYSDLGKEFVNNTVQDLFKKRGIKWYSNHNKSTRGALVERVILTIKRRIIRYISHSKQESFLPVLEKIVHGYNVSPHRGLHFKTPLDVHLMQDLKEIQEFAKKIYGPGKKKHQPSVGLSLAPEQVVRISSLKTPFKRVTTNNFTRELFVIDSIDKSDKPWVYRIREFGNDPTKKGNLVQGTFYKEDFSPVIDSGEYLINVHKTRKTKSGLEYLVSWTDFPNAERTWVKKQDMRSL